MHQKNQPKTTSNPTNRDAAVQIDVEADPYAKADAIWQGAIRRAKEQNPDTTPEFDNYGAGYWLAIQLQNLTSTIKTRRDMAKENIRDLVKLGKGE